jgi:hypothetical protein
MNEALLADLVSAVEQQLTSPSTPYVSKTFQRLTSLGLDPTEAKTQIAICLGEEMDEVMRQKRAFDEKAYRKSLDALPMEDAETDDPNPENPEP